MANHYIGCVTDFPDCRCLRCDRDDCEFDAPCCLEHGHPCNGDGHCPDFIDENEGPVRRWLRKLLGKLRQALSHAAHDSSPYTEEPFKDGEPDV